jgi:hypothetical protein
MEFTVFDLIIIYTIAGFTWGYALGNPPVNNFHFTIKNEMVPAEKVPLKPLLTLHPPAMSKNVGTVKGQAAEAKLQMAEFDKS